MIGKIEKYIKKWELNRKKKVNKNLLFIKL